MYKTIGLALILFFSAYLIAAKPALAGLNNWKDALNKGSVDQTNSVYNTITDTTTTTLAQYVGALTSWAAFIGFAFMARGVWAGYKWMTAAGDAEQIKEAKNILKHVFIGEMVIIFLYVIAYFIIRNLSDITFYDQYSPKK